MKKIIIIIFLVLTPFAGNAQFNKQLKDSLLNLIDTHQKRDSIRVNALIDIQNFFLVDEHEQGKKYIEEAIKISKEIDYKLGEGFSINAMGAYYMRRGETNKALECTLNAVDIFEKNNENKNIFAAYNNLAILYKNTKKYHESINVYMKMLDKLEGRPKTSSFVVIYFNIAGTYDAMDDQINCEKWIKKVIETSEELNFEQGIIEGKIGLSKLELSQNNYYEAIIIGNEIIEIAKNIGNISQTEAMAYSIIAEAYFETENYKEALENAQNSISIYNKINSVNYASDVYLLISKIYKKTNNYKKAYENAEKHHSIEDSLLSLERIKVIEELQTKYETEKMKREKETAELENLQFEKQNHREKEKNKQNRLLLIGTFALLITVIFFWILYSRQQKLKKQAELTYLKLNESQKRLNIERQKREAELKAIRSQLNPHFIFNVINSIQEFVILGEQQKANKALTGIAEMMRKTLKNSQQKLITLKEELDLVELYLNAEKLRFEDKLEYEIILSDNIEEEFMKIPPMIIQPYVENAVKHGIMHKKDNGKIIVNTTTTKDDFLKITVTDNGVGRRKASEIKKQNTFVHDSFSTKANSERLKNIAKETGTNANVEIIDLYDDHKTPTGTKIIITIPLMD